MTRLKPTRYQSVVPTAALLGNHKRITGFRLLLLLSFQGLLLPVLPGQERSYWQNPIVLNSEGADFTGNIASVVVDDKGYLWIGTDAGIYRYDGLQYLHFKHDPTDSTSLISDHVRHLFYDRDKNQLWISTWEVGKGLSILNLEDYTFKNYFYNEQVPGGITGSNIFWSYKDKFDHYWASTRGLSRYEAAVDTFREVWYPVSAKEMVDFPAVQKMISHSQDQLNDSILWMGTDAGLLKFNVVTEQFTRYPIVDFSGGGFSLRCVYHHTDNQVYVGTWAAGVYRFDPNSLVFERLPFFETSIEKGKPEQRIISIYPKNDEVLWVKTRAGLVEYHTVNEQVEHFKPNRPFENQVYGVNYVDEAGRIFTWSYGTDKPDRLFIYAPIRQQLLTYEKQDMDIESFDFIVRGLVQDKQKEEVLWINGQYTEGLYKLNLKTGSWHIYPPPVDYFNAINNTFQGWDLIELKSGELLVLADHLIYTISENSSRLQPWRIQIPNAKASLRRIIQDKEDNIWIGTHSDGLYKINPLDGIINHYEAKLFEDEDKMGAGSAYDLQEDRNGNIWVRGNGYSVYDSSKDTIYNFAYFFPEEKIVRHIQSLGVDKNGDVWISALSNGSVQAIGQADADFPAKGVVRHFKMDEHFNTEKAFEFILDQEGYTWLLSDGLERIRADGTPVDYYSSAYLNGKKFSQGISLQDGRIVIGFRRGVGIFHPDRLRRSEKTISPYVTSLRIFEKQIPLYAQTKFAAPIILQPNENFLEFALSVFNPAFFGEIEIQHQLIGIDENWVTTKAHRSANYTDLFSGDYTFKIRARKKGGAWTEQVYELPIHILTPWYLTVWAIGFYLISLGIFAFIVYRFLLSRKIAQQEALRLKELDTFKTRFYANITHEFRTPLTVIRGMTDELYDQPDDRWKQKLSLIRRNSQSLLELINQMLSLSKLQAGGLKLDLKQQDIITYLRYLVESYESYTRAQGISLQFYSEEEELMMDIDEQKLERIMLNLISNAIKFTPEHGKILIVAKPLLRGTEPELRIMVKDNGVGIKAMDLPYIFDPYRQGEGQQSHYSTGLGLALVKELVELMEGRIEVNSVPEKETRFYIYLPIRRTAQSVKNSPRQASIAQQKRQQAHNEVSSNLTPDENNDQPVILLVEDNADVAFYIENCLNSSYQVIHQRDGKAGLLQAYENIPDLIICDVMMPEMDGFEVCKQLKEDERTNHIPIILLTAKASAEDKLVGLQHGADAYLTKPFEKLELLTRVEKLLDLRRTLQDKFSQAMIASEEKAIASEVKNAFLVKIDAIISAQLDNESFSNNELARAVHLSRSQLYRKIKALTGLSTALYIRKVKLLQARSLLQNNELSVAEVAYKVGFKSPAYFSQAFKEEFGITPSATRK